MRRHRGGRTSWACVSCGLSSAHLPHTHVRHRGREGLTEKFADLVGVGSYFGQVVDEQQHGRQRKDTGEEAEIPELHQELDVLCKQALR